MAFYSYYPSPDDYSDAVYEAALRAFDQGPERLDQIAYTAVDETMSGHKFPRPVVIRHAMEKNYGGPIGSYRISDWQPDIPDEGGRSRGWTSMAGATGDPKDQWGRSWSSTSPEWVKVDGQWHNVSRLLWGGYRSDARRRADQVREYGAAPDDSQMTTHTSGAQTVTQPTSGWAAAGPQQTAGKAAKPAAGKAPKTASTSPQKKSSTSEYITNQYAKAGKKAPSGDQLAQLKTLLSAYY